MRPSSAEGLIPDSEFQFTHPGGVRQALATYHLYYRVFQFTHPGGVRPSRTTATTHADTFQFTHPGGVRPQSPTIGTLSLSVSIHAPGRGATSHYSFLFSRRESFNSRTREGCDVIVHLLIGKQSVSIHAPGRGATFSKTSVPMWSGRFNSRTREGCDRSNYNDTICNLCFNSRTREGCDSKLFGCSLHHSCFNSRTREGCDIFGWSVGATDEYVSIHAPGRGATRRVP